ncbi:hypothetical protein [Croceicoccus bisphenolivorans]|uniref:hypothetical protein n=1 Tax=Croceicoccus bisphenolivorans TaxID=1783232 RepID=UPI000A9B8B4B|nr:hypothetical protein [Croceicoccus bisphenolivorans]
MRRPNSPAIATFACVASLILAGCWQSDKPLMTAADSEQPIESGVYSYDMGNDDVQASSLLRFPGGGYIYYVKDEGALALMVRQVAKDWYVLQVSGDEGPDVLYGFGHREGNKVTIYDPVDCPEYLSDIKGLTIDGSDCEFGTLDALLEAGRRIVNHPKRDEVLEDPSGVLMLDTREDIY